MNNSDVKGWELLDSLQPFIKQKWAEEGFTDPTSIQEKSVPLALEGKDVIAESPTGTGKTLAYLIPALEKIDTENKNIQVMVLAPSHELVMQIYSVVQEWTKDTLIVSASFIGGANVKNQIDSLKKKPQIVVGSIGRIIELLNMKKLKMHGIKTIVIDEFDVLVAQEHANKLKTVIKSTLKDRQILCFSATLSEKTQQLAEEVMNTPQLVQVKRGEGGPINTEHLYVIAEERKKIDMLSRVLHTEDMKALVFINDQRKVPELETKLVFKGLDFGVLTGSLGKAERSQAIKSFRNGETTVLIASDVSARGLDISEITHVINFDLPFDNNQYIHRAGRTGRMGAKGTVISIVTNKEDTVLKRMCKKLAIDLEEKTLYLGKLVNPGEK